MALPRATGAPRIPGPRVGRTRAPEAPAARPTPTPVARNLEDFCPIWHLRSHYGNCIITLVTFV